MKMFQLTKQSAKFQSLVSLKSAVDAVQPVKANSVAELKEAVEKVRATNTAVLIEEYIKGNDCTVAVESDGKNVRSWE